MADERAKIPASDAERQQDLLKRLERIEEIQSRIARLRGMKTTVAGIGLILVLCTIALFVFNIINYVRTYDSKSLGTEFEKSFSYLAETKEARDLLSEIQRTCIPAFQQEITKRFQADEQKFKDELLGAADDVGRHLEGPVKERVLGALADSLKKLEEDILKRHDGFSTAQIQRIIEEGERHFVASFTERLEKRLDDVGADLEALNAGIQHLTDDPEYKSLDPKLAGEYESRLVEHLLELVIYNLNPQRGEQPAVARASAGGAK